MVWKVYLLAWSAESQLDATHEVKGVMKVLEQIQELSLILEQLLLDRVLVMQDCYTTMLAIVFSCIEGMGWGYLRRR